MPTESETHAAGDLIAFIDASPTPYHAVDTVRQRLESAGFREMEERDRWRVEPGDRCFVIRDGGTLVAFVAGTRPPSESGYLMLGAHTDSPNLRVKPQPDAVTAGHRQIGVEVYGGVLLHTWLDRDLSLGGRVSLVGGGTHRVRIERRLLRISNLAIHLYPTLATDGLKLNPQSHSIPSLGLATEEADGLAGVLARALADSGVPGAAPDRIGGYDLCLFDLQGAAVGGDRGEFVHAARLDNLASCHAGLTALLASGDAGEATRVLVLYDHEEVGSQSASGAHSRFVLGLLERIALGFEPRDSEAPHRALARSLLVSADMAHAVHPNYTDRHDPQHMPRIGAGPVIKINAGGAYATDGPAEALFEEVCREARVETQRFVSRNDMRCGSTIGPISAARLGVRTLDVGNPMLSMHSCRETAGTADHGAMIAALTRLLEHGKVPPPRD